LNEDFTIAYYYNCKTLLLELERVAVMLFIVSFTTISEDLLEYSMLGFSYFVLTIYDGDDCQME